MNSSMYIKSTLVLVVAFFSVSVAANCLPSSEYERIYCDIVGKGEGEGKGLPRFEDFKRNDVMVQKLLLKRPAEKLKIKLPASSKLAGEKTSATARSPDKLIEQSPNMHLNHSSELTYPVASNATLSQCTVSKNYIFCGQRRFDLKKNQSNNGLAQGVLDDQYLMALPPYNGNVNNDREVQFYLSGVYGVYLQRMIDIGLGASTMSYARFYHTFNDLQGKRVDFSERFETMYRFLKKDKKTMAVKASFNGKRPHSIAQCDDITDRIIACDSGSANWVYVN